MDFRMNRDEFFYSFLTRGSAFDWLTVLSLFLVALFLVLPQIAGRTVSGKSRACFLGATWVMVVKLFLQIVRTLLIHLELFGNVIGGGGGRGSPGMGAVMMLFFPVVEGMLFILALVLFVAGLPGMVKPKDDRWEPELPRREEER